MQLSYSPPVLGGVPEGEGVKIMHCTLNKAPFKRKVTQKIRIDILFLQKTHIRHIFFIEIQHKTHSISNLSNMHTFSKYVQLIKSKSTKSTYFFLKSPKSTTYIYVGTHGSCVRNEINKVTK